jgi:hypothetical protein
MVLHQLAYSSSSSGGGWSWIPISVVAAGIPILGPLIVRRMRKIRGPVVAGTAEVLSLRQFGSVAVNGPARMICRLRLRVSVLGQEPYDATVWRNIAPWDRQMAGAGQVLSAAGLLASGQRVPAALKSFAATGTTPRSLGRTPSRPELIDAPHYMLEVELHFPNLAPITARAVQPVPIAHVPSLAIGLSLTCAVDPADPSHRFVVDWDAPRSS